ncbi:MAG: hypothetical protein ACOZF0_07105 [Thermodesulfobacteriota bacterium]
MARNKKNQGKFRTTMPISLNSFYVRWQLHFLSGGPDLGLDLVTGNAGLAGRAEITGSA